MTRESLESLMAGRLHDHPGVASAYLFGSEAEVRSHRESDVDVGILLRRDVHPTASERFEQRLLLSSDLARGLGGRTVDVLILNDAPPQLARRVVTTGRRFFCGDPRADHVFVRDVQLKAADLEPFLRRMRRIKLQALARP
jgi:predicted nucleotidyltransferase